MSSSSSQSASASSRGEPTSASRPPGGNESSKFECAICFEEATEPVVTRCGHLYCWACLHDWLVDGKEECPVCKAGVTVDSLIPLYSRGGKEEDPRKKERKIPQRPKGERPQAPNRQRPQGGGWFQSQRFGGFGPANIAFSILPFPLGLFGAGFTFTLGGGHNNSGGLDWGSPFGGGMGPQGSGSGGVSGGSGTTPDGQRRTTPQQQQVEEQVQQAVTNMLLFLGVVITFYLLFASP